MSAYMTFGVRGYDDKFITLFTFNRCHYIYEVYEDVVPFGRLTTLNQEDLREVYDIIEGKRIIYNQMLDRDNERQKFLVEAKISTNEKMDILSDILSSKEEIKEFLKDLDKVEHFTDFLSHILEERHDMNEYYESVPNIDIRRYLYAGIEIPLMPNLDEEDNG